MFPKKNTYIIIGIALAVGAGVLALLWYYQAQGFIKIFPTQEDRRIKKALEIDRSIFRPAEGLKDEQFEQKIQELIKQREVVLKNKENSDEWFTFGKIKDFLNDHEGAARAWEISFSLQPQDFRTSISLANIYQYFVKDFAKAEDYYLKVLALRPDYTLAYEGLMDMYRYNMKEKRASYEPLVLQAIEKDPSNQTEYYYNLVEFFTSADTQDISRAKEYLKKVREKNPAKADELIESYPALKN